MKLSDNLYMYPEFGMLDSNTYLIKDDVNILVDPGSKQLLQNLLREINKDGFTPEDIGFVCNTHLHMDHYGADDEFRKLSGARVLLHPLQKQFYDASVVQTSRVFGMAPQDIKEDGILDGSQFSKSGLQLEIVSAPGHSADSICFYSKKKKFLICGDVIFARNIGRVDLPGGDAGQLKTSINSLSGMEIDLLCPGHMDYVQGKDEVVQNFDFIKGSVLPWV